jgi:hypothetical protein
LAAIDHLDLLQRQLELGRDRRAHRRRRLGRGVHAQRRVLGVPAGVHAAALHRHRRAALDVLGELQRVRGGGQRLLDVPGLLVVDGGDVVRDLVVDARARRAGGVHPDDDRSLLVGDPDPLAGVLRDVAVRGHDHDHRLADVVDLAVGQREPGPRRGQLRVRDEHRQRLGHRAGEVLVGVDRDDAVEVQARVDVDVDDPGVRVRAAHEGGGQRVVADVVEVAALAGDQPGVLASADRLAEELRRHELTSGDQAKDAMPGVSDAKPPAKLPMPGRAPAIMGRPGGGSRPSPRRRGVRPS